MDDAVNKAKLKKLEKAFDDLEDLLSDLGIDPAHHLAMLRLRAEQPQFDSKIQVPSDRTLKALNWMAIALRALPETQFAYVSNMVLNMLANDSFDSTERQPAPPEAGEAEKVEQLIGSLNWYSRRLLASTLEGLSKEEVCEKWKARHSTFDRHFGDWLDALGVVSRAELVAAFRRCSPDLVADPQIVKDLKTRRVA